MPFPSPPWQMAGDVWLSLFVLARGTAERPAGLYGAAFVDYSPSSTLAYHELVAARLVRDGIVPRVTVTDIWVDSAASRDGGRTLWALPKDLATLPVEHRRTGPVARTTWTAQLADRSIAQATFTAAPGAAARAPYAGSVVQTRDTGERVITGLSGSARATAAYGRWRFAPDGPLGWLHGHRPVASFRLGDFRLTVGA